MSRRTGSHSSQLVSTLLTACILGKKPDDHVFTQQNGRPVKNFGKTWKTVCTRAGVPSLLFHDLRRTAVRNLRRLGVTESVAMRISGHKTSSIFRRYDIVDEADLVAAARLLDAKQNSNGHDLGIVAENSIKNAAPAELNFAAAVLPN